MNNKSQIIIAGHNSLARTIYEECNQLGVANVDWNDFSRGKDTNVVIETENSSREHKKQAIQEIETSVQAEATILSTSLRMPATEIASWLNNSSRVIGFGAFSTINESGLVELAPALQTDIFHLRSAETFFGYLGKEIEVVEDEVGLVFPRILAMIINEAAFALTGKTADAHDIDVAMKKGTNYPYGPLEWAEKIGLEDVYAVLQGLFEQLGEDRYRPAPLIRKLIYAGWIGADVQKGFYYYQDRLKGEVMN
ncbi:3-hydroxyacyl-CoA dehydrogenase family protein [Lentibacillus salinarum]|uniref:3-hydroxyacyl-CoA dehydrogenase family protein n=1 Tax=Lentibacillus salinarum TaxID=446820 RepID=A0ABW3ZR13_9BACI